MHDNRLDKETRDIYRDFFRYLKQNEDRFDIYVSDVTYGELARLSERDSLKGLIDFDSIYKDLGVLGPKPLALTEEMRQYSNKYDVPGVIDDYFDYEKGRDVIQEKDRYHMAAATYKKMDLVVSNDYSNIVNRIGKVNEINRRNGMPELKAMGAIDALQFLQNDPDWRNDPANAEKVRIWDERIAGHWRRLDLKSAISDLEEEHKGVIEEVRRLNNNIKNLWKEHNRNEAAGNEEAKLKIALKIADRKEQKLAKEKDLAKIYEYTRAKNAIEKSQKAQMHKENLNAAHNYGGVPGVTKNIVTMKGAQAAF